MASFDGNGDLKATAEEKKRCCQSELEKLGEKRKQVLIDLGAAVADREKDNLAFWADYQAEYAAISDIEEQIETFEALIADAEKMIEQENNRKRSDEIKDSPWTKVCSCGAICPALAKFCPSCGAKVDAEDDIDSDPTPQPKEPTRQCPSCGKLYAADLAFCELCGIRLEDIPDEVPDTDQAVVRGNEVPDLTVPIPVSDSAQEDSAQEDSPQEVAADEYAICSACGTSNKSRAKFCGNCGMQLK